MEARGFSLGLASHGIGTARAMSKDKNAGVFAAVGMGLSGLTTSILVPLFFKNSYVNEYILTNNIGF
jgi:putative effector of murein hydrolase